MLPVRFGTTGHTTLFTERQGRGSSEARSVGSPDLPYCFFSSALENFRRRAPGILSRSVSAPSYDLASRPEIHRVHRVALVALVGTRGGANPYLAEALLEDVGSVATALHPAPEDLGRTTVTA